MLHNFGPKSLPFARSLSPKLQTEVIAVTSGKGGVGKSSVSVNMAIAMQQSGRKVLLIDADIHLGSIDLILGIRPRYSVADVVNGIVSLDGAIMSIASGIDVLPAGGAIGELLAMEDALLKKLATAFRDNPTKYDVIVLDTGAGISPLVLAFVLGAHKVLLVATPDPAAMADAYAMIKMIRHQNAEMPIMLFTNMVASYQEGNTLFQKMGLMVQKFLSSQIDFGGAMLKDELIAKSVKAQQPFILAHPNAPAARAIRNVVQRLNLLKNSQEKNLKPFFEQLIQNRKMPLEFDV